LIICYFNRYVTKPLTGNFLASQDGYWEGNDKFTYSNAIYEFDFTNFEANDETYGEKFEEIRNTYLKEVGELAKNQTLVYNLLYWTNYVAQFSMDDVNIQTMSFVASASAIFNKNYFYGSIANYEGGRCLSDHNVTNIINYDRQTSEVEIIWDEDEYSKSCSVIMDPVSLGYSETYDLNKFSVTIDLTSLTTALAANLGIFSADYMEDVGEVIEADINGLYVRFQPKYDPRYPNMNPVVCAFWNSTVDYDSDEVESNSYCFYYIRGSGLAIPTFNHYGDYCIDCNTTSQACEIEDAWCSYCDNFFFVAGLIYYGDSNDSLEKLGTLAISMTAKQLNDAAQQAAKYSAGLDYYLPVDELFTFCNNECTMISFLMYDYNFGVSPYYYDLTNGHCEDSFNTNNWDSFVSNPPSKLTEQYFRCYSFRYDAVFNSLGVAMGNLDIIAPIILFCVLLPLIYIFLKAIGVKVEKERFSQEDRDRVTNELAMVLLSIESKEGNDQVELQGVLAQIVREIKHASVKYTHNDNNSNSDDIKKIDKSNLQEIVHESLDVKDNLTQSHSNSIEMTAISNKYSPSKSQGRVDAESQHVYHSVAATSLSTNDYQNNLLDTENTNNDDIGSATSNLVFSNQYQVHSHANYDSDLESCQIFDD
jgi:hypothetical protein